MAGNVGLVTHVVGADTIPTSAGGAMAFLASGEDTHGAYGFREFTMPPGATPVQPHRHHRTEEAFYVRAGELTFLVDKRAVVATPGTLIVVPRGVTHAFFNRGTAAATFAMIDSPPNIAPWVWRGAGGSPDSPHGRGGPGERDTEWLPEVRWVGRPEGRGAITTEMNKAMVCGWYERGLGAGDLALADAFFAPAYTNFPSGRRSSPAQARQFVAALRAALPDLTVRIEELIAEGDRVVICFTCAGTHSGAFGDFPPTGKAVRFTEVCILRFADGKVIERRVAFEGASLLEQLGARVASA